MTVLLVLAGSAQAASTRLEDRLQKSESVLRFFGNHSWLQAPNQRKCSAVPWARSCTIARKMIDRHRTRAREIRAVLHRRWLYDWPSWLPSKFARVGACETGYGHQPGNWNHDSGTYVSAFGIIRPAYDDFSGRLGYPGWDAGGRSPRQQYEVAAAIQQAYGWSAWGCGGA